MDLRTSRYGRFRENPRWLKSMWLHWRATPCPSSAFAQMAGGCGFRRCPQNGKIVNRERFQRKANQGGVSLLVRGTCPARFARSTCIAARDAARTRRWACRRYRSCAMIAPADAIGFASARCCGFSACDGRLQAVRDAARESSTREPGENPGRGPTLYARARIRRLKGRSLGAYPGKAGCEAAGVHAGKGMPPCARALATVRARRPTGT